MLRRLVPHARTHRLAPLIAGMLQYATLIASADHYEDTDVKTLAKNLELAEESNDFDEIKSLLSKPLQQLFDDADAVHERSNYRGESYSIIDSAIHEYMTWYDMPWES